ncbi:beta-propeller fold lactonase family protein [Streptomyces sp. NPDC048191]|uniref:beta-propeller fold lactonase family protein n=1 Tax=Streptomyces sp. NPDC048191 TaxID=3155484 RepID=UPI0033D420EA
MTGGSVASKLGQGRAGRSHGAEGGGGGGGAWRRLLRVWVAGLVVLAGVVVPLSQVTPAAAQAGRSLAYVTNFGADTVSVVDTATNTVIGQPITVGDAPVGVAVSPNGTRVYVANSGSNTVSVISTATNTVIGQPITVGTSPAGLAVSPDNSRVYVANSGSNNVSVIDTATNTVIGQPITVGAFPQNVAFGPDGTRLYVTNTGSNNVSVIDTTTNPPHVLSSISVGVGPWDVAAVASPGGTTVLYVSNSGSNNVSVIDTTLGPVATIPVGRQPRGLAVATIAFGIRVYVTDFADATVSVIQTNAGHPPTRIATLPVGRQPQGAAVTPDNTRVYVTNTISSTVSVIDNTTTAPTVLPDTITGFANPVDVATGITPLQQPPTIPTTLKLKAEKRHEHKKNEPGARGNDRVTLTATLTAQGRPLKGKTITFTTDSTLLCTATTDRHGQATCTVPGRHHNKTCYTATFTGDDTYRPSTATACVQHDHGTPCPSAGWGDRRGIHDHNAPPPAHLPAIPWT